MTATTSNLADVPLPASAVRVCDWDDVEHGDPHRYFVGSSWVIDRPDHEEDLQVWLDGAQRPDRIRPLHRR
jgi:hypothetical protein